MTGGGQQHQRPVAHHVQRLGEWRQAGIGRGLRADPVPFQPRELDVVTQEATQLRARPGQLGPFGGRYKQFRIRQVRQPADVVLVQVGQDRGVDICRGIPERGELGGEGVLRADVEAGEPVIQVAGETAGEVVVIGDRGAVLPGVEQDQPAGVLDDVDVDRPRRRPMLRRQQPPVHRLSGPVRVFGADPNGTGADHRHRLHRSRRSGFGAGNRGQRVHGLNLFPLLAARCRGPDTTRLLISYRGVSDVSRRAGD